MKKSLVLLFMLVACCISLSANAVEIKIEGRGVCPLTGYDMSYVRGQQDAKMSKKAHNSNIEAIQTQQIKEATRQAETRKKQDKRMDNAVRVQVVSKAQERAKEAAINILIDRTLGANASKKPEIMEKMADVLSQSSTYIIDENYTGEVQDNNYVARVFLTVDETEFRTLVSDMGIAINTQEVRAHSIMIILDEFFAAPSNLSQSTATKESITYKRDKNERDVDKEAYKSASSSKSAYAGYYSKAGASSKSGTSYGKFSEYTNNESEFFQYIKEYAPTTPKAQNLNYTQSALSNSFVTYDIRALDNDVFKSKYFKGKPISSDRLANSAELAGYIDAARKDAKADFFAIGVAYITDNGKNANTGRSVADGNVFIKVYSTTDSELIAAGVFTETASGNSPDQARTAVANKIGTELGEVIAKKIQDYWKRRTMYGSEYIIQIKGNFLPVERITINKAIQSTNGVKSVKMRSSDNSLSEFTVTYSGEDSAADAIFMKLYESGIGSRFKNYDYKVVGNQIIFSPIK